MDHTNLNRGIERACNQRRTANDLRSEAPEPSLRSAMAGCFPDATGEKGGQRTFPQGTKRDSTLSIGAMPQSQRTQTSEETNGAKVGGKSSGLNRGGIVWNTLD